MNKQELKNWIADSPETNAKELKWQLIDMGVYVNESDITGIQLDLLREQCRCGNNGGGDCEACYQARYVGDE